MRHRGCALDRKWLTFMHTSQLNVRIHPFIKIHLRYSLHRYTFYHRLNETISSEAQRHSKLDIGQSPVVRILYTRRIQRNKCLKNKTKLQYRCYILLSLTGQCNSHFSCSSIGHQNATERNMLLVHRF